MAVWGGVGMHVLVTCFSSVVVMVKASVKLQGLW